MRAVGKPRFSLSLILLLGAALVGQSFASVFIKLTGAQPLFAPKFLLFLVVAVMLLVLYAFMWQLLLEKVDLTNAYMFKGVTYILILIWSVLIFQETITLPNLIGSTLIIAGVAVNAGDI